MNLSGWTPSRAVNPRRAACVALLAFTVPLGLAWRLAPLHLSPFALKYGGSALWAVAVYWVIAALQPRWNSVRLAFTAALSALTIELIKLVYWPPLDRFRETLAGKLLLGRYFTFGAIAAYWIAITAVAWADSRMRETAGKRMYRKDRARARGDAQTRASL